MTQERIEVALAASIIDIVYGEKNLSSLKEVNKL